MRTFSRGLLIDVEGIWGKTTQIRLLANHLAANGVGFVVMEDEMRSEQLMPTIRLHLSQGKHVIVAAYIQAVNTADAPLTDWEAPDVVVYLDTTIQGLAERAYRRSSRDETDESEVDTTSGNYLSSLRLYTPFEDSLREHKEICSGSSVAHRVIVVEAGQARSKVHEKILLELKL